MNASELLLRLRYVESPKGWLHGDNGSNQLGPPQTSPVGLQELDILAADTPTPEYRQHPPRPLLTDAERGNPVVVWTVVQ
jgi:hypothetical protein